MTRHFQPKLHGEVRVRPGRSVVWLSRPSTLSLRLFGAAAVLFALSLFVLGIPVGPMIWYSVKPAMTQDLAKLLSRSVVGSESAQVEARVVSEWQPPIDTTLAPGGWLKIPAIKVNTRIVETPSENYEQALAQGVWRVPELGTPLKRSKPTILVAHRFGYLKWSNIYRRDHSFYNLPKLKVGDSVEIDWGQRKYVYEVYAGDEGTEITDYSADLILYTCQYLESDRRIFRYAKLVQDP